MVKNLPTNEGDAGLILSQEDPQEQEMEIHSSFLARIILMDRGAWGATIFGVTKSQTQLSTHALMQ